MTPPLRPGADPPLLVLWLLWLVFVMGVVPLVRVVRPVCLGVPKLPVPVRCALMCCSTFEPLTLVSSDSSPVRLTVSPLQTLTRTSVIARRSWVSGGGGAPMTGRPNGELGRGGKPDGEPGGGAVGGRAAQQAGERRSAERGNADRRSTHEVPPR